MYKSILVPLDGSKLAEAILPHAEFLAKTLNAEIVLLSVVVPTPPFAADEMVTYPATDEAVEVEAEAYLTSVRERLHRQGLRVRAATRSGQAADQIVDYAREAGISLIAMCTHGRSGLGRWVMGSVADKVLRGAETPILLLRVKGKG